MRRVDDRQPAREHPAVPGSKLAGVQHHGGHIASVRSGPRRAARRTPGRSSSRCDPPGPAAAAGTRTTTGGHVRRHAPAAAASLTLLGQPLGRDRRIVRCTRPLTFSAQRRTGPGSRGGSRRPARLEVRAQEPMRRSSTPFACGSPARGSPSQPAADRRTTANASVGRPPAAIADSRSQTSFSGSAPSRHRLRPRPQQDVRRLLAEDQGAGDRPRPARLTGHHPPATRAHGRPGRARSAPTNRTAPTPPADRSSAETSAAQNRGRTSRT